MAQNTRTVSAADGGGAIAILSGSPLRPVVSDPTAAPVVLYDPTGRPLFSADPADQPIFPSARGGELPVASSAVIRGVVLDDLREGTYDQTDLSAVSIAGGYTAGLR